MADFFQHGNQLLLLGGFENGGLFDFFEIKRFDASQQRAAVIGQFDYIKSSVRGGGGAFDEAGFFHAVDQGGDIGAVDEHHFGDLGLVETIIRAALMSQEHRDIELHVAEPKSPEKLIGPFFDTVGGMVDI